MKRNKIIYAGLLVTGSFLFSGLGIPQNKISPASPNKVVAPANLTFYWIDTEGGAATLIITPTGESVLIDSGNPGGRDSERIYEVAHNIAGLSQIDHLITTHWHIDHFGGAAELAKKMPVKEVLDKGIPDMLQEDKNFAANIKPYREMQVGKRTLIKPNELVTLKKLSAGNQKLSMRFVGVEKKFVSSSKTPKAGQGCEGITDKNTDLSDNANSMVFVLDYGNFRFFDGGDLTWNIEKTLVCPIDLVGTVDVFQVNHHGLDQSNNPVLVKSLAPTVSIMGNGTRKGADPETVTTLRNTPSIQAQYQLHKNIRQDSQYNTEEHYIANLEENCKANYVKMTVMPDGKKYTVSIPATKHEKTFSTKTVH